MKLELREVDNGWVVSRPDEELDGWNLVAKGFYVFNDFNDLVEHLRASLMEPPVNPKKKKK